MENCTESDGVKRIKIFSAVSCEKLHFYTCILTRTTIYKRTHTWIINMIHFSFFFCITQFRRAFLLPPFNFWQLATTIRPLSRFCNYKQLLITSPFMYNFFTCMKTPPACRQREESAAKNLVHRAHVLSRPGRHVKKHEENYISTLSSDTISQQRVNLIFAWWHWSILMHARFGPRTSTRTRRKWIDERPYAHTPIPSRPTDGRPNATSVASRRITCV